MCPGTSIARGDTLYFGLGSLARLQVPKGPSPPSGFLGSLGVGLEHTRGHRVSLLRKITANFHGINRDLQLFELLGLWKYVMINKMF